VAEQPDLLPAPRVDAKKSLDWNRSKFANAMTQGILQGESIPKLAERISDVVGSDYAASVRYARTAMTGAQNAGRTTRQQEAADMGIDVRRQWMATLDSRTRDSHRLMDGETVGVNEEFSNGLMYPGDPSGDPSEVYNCRCTVVSVVDGKSVVNGSSGRVSVGLQGKSYEEWKAGHGD
jgi:SPP1 gp7 family putative phage head morphogenesis protein